MDLVTWPCPVMSSASPNSIGVSPLELAGGPVVHGDFHPAVDDEEVLTPRRVVPVAEAILGGTAEDQVLTRFCGNPVDRFCGGVQVLEVGLAVIAGIDAHNHA